MVKWLKNSRYTDFGLLLSVTALVFGPFLFQLTYYRDDWYYMYDGLLGGAKIFHTMFASDRPFRGYFFELFYTWFGVHPLYYHIGAYLWRLASVFCFLWLLRLIWPERRREALWGALLFALYPGYLWWVSAIEYQPMIASLFFQLLSIGLTVKAIKTHSAWGKAFSMFGAILTGWVYIALVDYAIGMEVFRLLVVALVVYDSVRSRKENFRAVARAWAINLVIPVGFLFWRVFFFQSERKATDIGLQLSRLLDTSGLAGFWWVVRWVQSSLNVLFLAWGVPLYGGLFSLRLRELALGFLVMALSVAITLLGDALHITDTLPASEENAAPARVQAFWVGLLGVLAGILPVVAANRYIEFERFSHYALPFAPAGVICVLGLVFLIGEQKVRRFVLASLIGFAALTHFSNGMRALNEEKAIQQYWWQMTWRVPDIASGTTLMVFYPNIAYGEDYETVSGPANFIYYPNPEIRQTPGSSTVSYPLSSLPQTGESTRLIQVGRNAIERTVRSHHFSVDYGNTLVASRPGDGSCLHVIDPRWPLFSASDSSDTQLAGMQSKITNVLVEKKAPATPPAFLFGSEPAHDWCYFFEKADLARQQGNWDAIIKLGAAAQKQDARPNDPIEWLPFVQAYAYTGDMQKIKEISTRINTDAFYKKQACQVLNQMGANGFPLSANALEQAQSLFCGG